LIPEELSLYSGMFFQYMDLDSSVTRDFTWARSALYTKCILVHLAS